MQTRSNFEKIVAEELASKGVENYLPAFREVRRWKDRRKELEVPLFPGYVFVRMLDTASRRVAVMRSRGAVRLLGCAGAIHTIPDVEIESVRQLIGSRAPFFAHPFLREGARVRVRRGPLSGVEGILHRARSASRLVVSVEMLSQSVATEIDSSDIEVIAPPRP